MLIDRITYTQASQTECFYPKADAAEFDTRQFSDLRQEREAMVQFSHIVQQVIHKLTIVHRHGTVDPEEARDHLESEFNKLNEDYLMPYAGVIYKERPKGVISIEIYNIHKQSITIWLKP